MIAWEFQVFEASNEQSHQSVEVFFSVRHDEMMMDLKSWVLDMTIGKDTQHFSLVCFDVFIVNCYEPQCHYKHSEYINV